MRPLTVLLFVFACAAMVWGSPTYVADPVPGSVHPDANHDVMAVRFASATCANDVLEGLVKVPEPGPSFLIGAGLLSLGLIRRRLRSR